jgi:hypothetical protein
MCRSVRERERERRGRERGKTVQSLYINGNNLG